MMIKYEMKVLNFGKVDKDWKEVENEIVDLLAKDQGYASTDPRKKAQAAVNRLARDAGNNLVIMHRWIDTEKNEDFTEERQVSSKGDTFMVKVWLRHWWDEFKIWLWTR